MISDPAIIGAGMAGCIAAYILPRSPVKEASPRDGLSYHRAVLRFRSDEVSKVTGVPFREVTVRKGIFHKGQFVAPSIRLANMYSQKVVGRVIDRSIWNLDPVKRYVAPPDFHQRMLDHLGSRITYGSAFSFGAGDPVISTVPMPATLKALGIAPPERFDYYPVTVVRGEIVDADVHQSVYFPDMETPLYRLSITGNQIIAEFTRFDNDDELEPFSAIDETYLALERAMGIPSIAATLERQATVQKHGKIAPIKNAARKNVIHSLTLDHGIYSLGRFATWRNILLDDVVNDVGVIRQLLEMDSYDRRVR